MPMFTSTTIGIVACSEAAARPASSICAGWSTGAMTSASCWARAIRCHRGSVGWCVVTRTLGMPAAAITSASDTFETVTPVAPNAICRRAISGDRWPFAWGRHGDAAVLKEIPR